MKKRALIAMSGGVDSSVAAYLIKGKGMDCLGITMKLFQGEENDLAGGATCCSLADIEDARRISIQLNIPYYVFNFKDQFHKDVIQHFIQAYENGQTPNPCIDCNRYLKFDQLYRRAKELDYYYVVTGHYARIEQQGDQFFLKKAVDATKDQSYVLYTLTQEKLAHTLFPLGDYTKPKVRFLARKFRFNNADKADSQDICFVPDGDYARFIKNKTRRHYAKGHFIGLDGKILGQHKGIIHYTIGQRKGLGLSFPRPVYVHSIHPENNTIVLCEESGLYGTTLIAHDINWISGKSLEHSIRLKAKIRYREPEQWATVIPLENNQIQVTFDEPQRAITQGQAVVLYDGDYVIGGGVILRTNESLSPPQPSVSHFPIH